MIAYPSRPDIIPRSMELPAMTPLPDAAPSQSGDWRSICISWLTRQPAPTVLLFLIVIGGGYTAMIQLPSAVDRLEKSNTERLSIATSAFDRDQLRDQQRYESLQRFNEELIRNRNGRENLGQRPLVKNHPAALNAPL
jgi:hypothetical protein